MPEWLTMLLIFQIWGGVFYLLNKIFFSKMERSIAPKERRKWRILSWVVYMIGILGWGPLFVIEHNWIAFSIEVGGLPAMALGLVIALRGKGREPRWLDYITLTSVVIGISCSLLDFGGITSLSQILELSLTTGFLVGTYLLAKKNPRGYLWFMLMNISCGALMLVQGWILLMVQQIISLGFVVDAYRHHKRN